MSRRNAAAGAVVGPMVDAQDHVHHRPDRDDVAVRRLDARPAACVMSSIVRIATSGTLMIGIVRLLPSQPVLSTVNVPPPNVVDPELVGAGPGRDVGDRAVEAGDRELVDVAHDRHDEPVVDRDRDAHVDPALRDEALLGPVGVERGCASARPRRP